MTTQAAIKTSLTIALVAILCPARPGLVAETPDGDPFGKEAVPFSLREELRIFGRRSLPFLEKQGEIESPIHSGPDVVIAVGRHGHVVVESDRARPAALRQTASAPPSIYKLVYRPPNIRILHRWSDSVTIK